VRPDARGADIRVRTGRFQEGTMGKRGGGWPLRAALIVLAAALWVVPAFSAEFTADMVEVRGKTTRTSKLSVMGHNYAIEFEEEGQRGKVTVDLAKGVTRVFMPSEKKFIKMASDSMRSLANDPIQAFMTASRRYTAAKEGTETVGGYSCDKIVVSSQGKKLMTGWVARDLGYPVKVVTHGKEAWTMELKNIQPGAVSPDLFMVPADYKKVDKTSAGSKKAAAPQSALTSPVKGTVPMGRRLGPGGEMRVTVAGNRAVKVSLKNLAKGESAVLVLPFRDGKQVESIGVNPTTLKNLYATWDRDFNSPSTLKMSASFRVDEVVVRAEKGLVLARVEQEGKGTRDLFNGGGYTTWVKARPGKPLAMTITGADQDGGDSTGRILLKREGGGQAEKLAFTLKSGETKTWTYPASEGINNIQITVGEGEGMIKIHMDQTGAIQGAGRS
jgi:hypothetical protein